MARAVALSSPVISLGYWQDCCTGSFTKIIRSTLSAERLVLRTFSKLQSTACTVPAALTGGREEARAASGDPVGESCDEAEALAVTIVVHCDPDTSVPTKCLTCGMRMEENDTMVCLGAEFYHATCIVCGKCGGAIEPSEEVFVHNGSSVVCKQCAPKCSSCGEEVDYKYIHVLNKDYHDSCLKCSHCNTVPV